MWELEKFISPSIILSAFNPAICPSTYVLTALILSVLTAIEVGIFYITSLGYWMIPILAILSIGKFALVVMVNMHLKYETKLITILFLSGLLLATAVVFALMILFRSF